MALSHERRDLTGGGSRIAVIGCQCRRSYLSLKQAIWKSAAATDKTAKRCRLSSNAALRSVAAALAAANHGTPVCTVQNTAAAV